MSGKPDLNYPTFFRAAKRLEEKGYAVSNPAQYPPRDTAIWEDYLRRDIKDLMDCDGVCTLPNWAQSKGASLEVDIARRLNMPVYSIEVWLTSDIREWEAFAKVRRNR